MPGTIKCGTEKVWHRRNKIMLSSNLCGIIRQIIFWQELIISIYVLKPEGKMKNLVVYYSKSGNTETVAKEIAKAINGDIKKIELEKEIGLMSAAFSAFFGLKVKIKSKDFNLQDYDNIFIGTPVWAGKTSTPINTFLSKANLAGKNVYIFATQGDNKTPSSVYESVKTRVEAKGGKVIDNFFVQTEFKNPITIEQASIPVSEWIKKNNLG